MPYIDQGNC